MTKAHRHKWGRFYLKAIAVYRKRDCDGNDVPFLGRTEVCHICGMMRFICDDKRLNIVEVEL